MPAVIEKAMTYKLSELPYAYSALEPHISEKLLTIHHTGHHQAYVNGANDVDLKIHKARAEGNGMDLKCALKALSFNIGGIVLHDFFWLSLAPSDQTGKPGGPFAAAVTKEFGSIEGFKKEFTRAALSIEGGGWAVLALGDVNMRPAIIQVEKHNINAYPTFPVIMVIDMWEHAYYLDYNNDRLKYLDAIWNVVNWNGISKRWDEMMKWIPEQES